MWKKWHHVHKVCTLASKDAKTSFNLADVSPALANAHDMRASVPGETVRSLYSTELTWRAGTYIRHAGEDIFISGLNRHVDILSSKQRPRKLTMRGSDGKTYRFLLKAREDLRMDERCGQLVCPISSKMTCGNGVASVRPGQLATSQRSLRRQETPSHRQVCCYTAESPCRYVLYDLMSLPQTDAVLRPLFLVRAGRHPTNAVSRGTEAAGQHNGAGIEVGGSSRHSDEC